MQPGVIRWTMSMNWLALLIIQSQAVHIHTAVLALEMGFCELIITDTS